MKGVQYAVDQHGEPTAFSLPWIDSETIRGRRASGSSMVRETCGVFGWGTPESSVR